MAKKTLSRMSLKYTFFKITINDYVLMNTRKLTVAANKENDEVNTG